MKTIRFLAGFLMIITGILHVVSIFKETLDSNTIPTLGFGIIYLAIGIFLLLDKKFSKILGVIFPLIGLGVGFFIVGLRNWNTMLAIMFIIDAIVVVCCFVLLLSRYKVKT